MLDAWESAGYHPFDGREAGSALALAPPVSARLAALDDECRLAAYDPHVSPASLLLLQASLAAPPRDWKKHSLPCLARQALTLTP